MPPLARDRSGDSGQVAGGPACTNVGSDVAECRAVRSRLRARSPAVPSCGNPLLEPGDQVDRLQRLGEPRRLDVEGASGASLEFNICCCANRRRWVVLKASSPLGGLIALRPIPSSVTSRHGRRGVGEPFALNVPGMLISRAGLAVAVSTTTASSLYALASNRTDSATKARCGGSLG
jgi:hypothetical protein